MVLSRVLEATAVVVIISKIVVGLTVLFTNDNNNEISYISRKEGTTPGNKLERKLVYYSINKTIFRSVLQIFFRVIQIQSSPLQVEFEIQN